MTPSQELAREIHRKYVEFIFAPKSSLTFEEKVEPLIRSAFEKFRENELEQIRLLTHPAWFASERGIGFQYGIRAATTHIRNMEV